MFRNLSLLLTAALAAVALSGCAGDAPSGTIGQSQHDIIVDGAAMFDYHPFENEFDPGFPEDPSGNLHPSELCALGAITENDETGTLPRCHDAFTSINVSLGHETPEPSQAGYGAYLVGPEGELSVGALSMNEHGGYEVSAAFDDDLAGQYDVLEVRDGDFALATAATSAGSNTLALPDAVPAAGFTGTWEGNTLSITVSGLPANSTYVGWLVLVDSETGEKTHDVQFPVANGEVEYEAGEPINHWAEVHIHMGASKINLGIAAISDA